MTYKHCVTCKQPFSNLNVFTAAGKRECQISGLCEICYDALFEGTDDEDNY
jgi:hypothetical protein